MLIRNVSIHGYEETSRRGDIIIEDDTLRILQPNAVISSTYTIIDPAEELALMPGWLDTHVHGYGGHDFADATEETLPIITAALGKTGLSYCMATLVSLSEDKLKKALHAINDYVASQDLTPGSTEIVGVHLEGPWIAADCNGAHDLAVLQNEISLEKFLSIISVAPNIKHWKITLDPQLKGALQFIREVTALKDIHVKVSIGHCNPPEDIITQAIEAGATGFTHLGNACKETCCRLHHALKAEQSTSQLTRWVLTHPEKCPAGVEIIADGIHVSSSFIQLINEAIGDKFVLITDALGPSGLEDGIYKLGSRLIKKEGEAFYLADIGDEKKLAGSAAALSTITEKFIQSLAGVKKDVFSTIYKSTVQNPRDSSLGIEKAVKLDDMRNFVLLNKKGKLILSNCQGKLTKHKSFNLSLTWGLTAHKNVLVNQNNSNHSHKSFSLQNL